MSIDIGNGAAAPGWAAWTADDASAGGSSDGLADSGPRSLADYVISVAAEDDAAILRYYAGLGRPVASGGAPPSTGGDGGGSVAPSSDAPTVLVEDFGNFSPAQAGPPSVDGLSRSGGGGGGHHHGGGGGSVPPTYQKSNGNGLTFVIDWDSSVANAPSGFAPAFENAVQYFLDNLSSPLGPITITLDAGWGEAGGQRLSFGALGESLTNIFRVDYGSLQQAMPSYLPAADPIVTSHYYWVASAEEKALGLLANNTSVDGAVGFSSGVAWNFSGTAGSGYDFISVAEHEISETMGRIALLGQSISDGGIIYQNGYTPLDLFRYSATGTRSLTGGPAAYFSFDGGNTSGATNLQGNSRTYFNSTAGGDWGDWQSSGANTAGGDAYNAFASSGVLYSTSAVDKTVMQVLGYGPQPVA